MSIASSFLTSCHLDYPLSFKSLGTHKTYILDPKALKYGDWVLIGEGMSGAVIRAKFIAKSSKMESKEKKFALKFLYAPSCPPFDEYKCHCKIISRVAKCKEQLEKLEIIPGTGIEKKPIYASFDNKDIPQNYIVKQLYNGNLNQAIQAGYLENNQFLISASTQIVQGLITLMTVGAIYLDLKPSNILCGRKNKFEVVLSDFEKISFIKFSPQDHEIIKNVCINIPPYLAHDQELFKLHEIQKKDQPAQEFINKLHCLYVFMLGALFFEMATKTNIKKFIIISDIFTFLQKYGITKFKSSESLENYLRAKDLNSFIEKINHFCENHKIPPYKLNYAIEMLEKKGVLTDIRSRILLSGVPEFFADLVIQMLTPDATKRIKIYDILSILRRNENPSKRLKITK